MLRTKQLGTLSQCARSFILSGPRCGSADGGATSCTCSEDETYVPRRQPNSTGLLYKQKSSVVTEAAAKGASPCFKNASGSVNHHNPEGRGFPVSAPNVLSPKSSLRSENSGSLNGKFNSTSEDVRAVQNDLVHSSKLTAERLVKAGIATVGMLSDLMNYRIPTPNGHGNPTPQNCMVDSTQPLSNNMKSSNGKSRNRGNYSKVQQNRPVNIGGGSKPNSTAANDCPGVKIEKNGSVKAKQNIRGTSVGCHRLQADTQSQRQAAPQRAKYHSNNFISDAKSGKRTSESKVAATIAENGRSVKSQHSTATRSMRTQAGGAPSASSSMNAGRPVEQFCYTLQQLKWGPTAEEALGNLRCRLDPFQANKVLKQLQDHSVALGFFHWLKRQPGFKHDEHTYTTMVGILGQARQFGALRRLLEEMIRDGCWPTVVTYNRLIHVYGRANYIDEAVNVFHQMQEDGCEPDRVTYCTLIDIHAKAGFLEVALDLYQRMQEVGLTPDTFTYSLMVNCLGKGGHLAAAYKLFCEMVGQGCVPNLVTYNIMIALQAKARNYPCAVKLYRDMQAAGFRPDKITHSIVMEVLGHCGHLDEAEAVFVEMKRDWIPDEPVYGLLVDLWGKAGNVDKARAWYQSMLDAGLRPNVPTCNSLLSAFLRVHRFSDAYDVLQDMLGLGLIPSLQTYTLLLSCCTETCSQMGLCGELMAISGHPAHTFLLSLPDAEPGGQNVRDHASSFLDIMHSEDRESKRGILDAVIDFLHKSGLKEEAGSVWEVAVQRNVYPDAVTEKSSSYWLINLHVMSDGTAVTALSRTLAWFRRQMLDSGIGPHRIDIVTGWGRRSRVTGSSLVRQSVQELLQLFRFPFFTQNGNSGCFVGCGEPLCRWLLNSYVERMHLL